jgi:predicted nuclease with TOPRIM domain
MASTVKTVKTETIVEETIEVVDLTGTEAAKMFAEFESTKAAIRQLEAMKAELEAELRKLLGKAERATFEGQDLFKLAHSSNSKINRDVLRTAFPEAYDATLETKPYTFIKAA